MTEQQKKKTKNKHPDTFRIQISILFNSLLTLGCQFILFSEKTVKMQYELVSFKVECLYYLCNRSRKSKSI